MPAGNHFVRIQNGIYNLILDLCGVVGYVLKNQVVVYAQLVHMAENQLDSVAFPMVIVSFF